MRSDPGGTIRPMKSPLRTARYLNALEFVHYTSESCGFVILCVQAAVYPKSEKIHL